MITEFFIGLGTTVAAWFIGMFPSWTAPSWLTGLDETINSFLSSFGGTAVWVPWALIFICVGVSLGAWLIGLGVKALRAFAGHIPFVGGNG